VACGATAEVLTAANLARTRAMVEAFDEHAGACDAPEALAEPAIHRH
jgi:zinc/manganese transport system ATP-binding protein